MNDKRTRGLSFGGLLQKDNPPLLVSADSNLTLRKNSYKSVPDSYTYSYKLGNDEGKMQNKIEMI